jgi:hypothetical protein
MARATKLRVVGGKTSVYVTPRAPKHGLEIGAPCPNCGTPLAGPWCYACGQKGQEFHRSVWHLLTESFESLTHFDGRFWKTLPNLLVRPGKLTRDYLDGHRAAQIPPFRLFLVVLLLVFFAGSLSLERNPVRIAPAETFIASDSADGAQFQKAAEAMRATNNGKWLIERAETAIKHPEDFLRAMEHWSHQFAILMLPIAALMLSVLFVFKRGVYVFDHLIFSMHSLAFQGLLLTGVFLGGLAAPWAAWFLLLAPAHLFVHMREAYRISTIGTLIRMFLLFNLSAAAFIILMVGLMFVGLATLH